VTGRDRIVLLAVLGAVVLGAFYFLAIKPKRAEVSKLKTDVTSQQQELDSARNEVAASQNAQRQFASDYATVARLGKAVPADDDVPSLVYQIQDAAKSTDIDFREVDVAKSSGAAPAPPAPTSGQPTTSKPGEGDDKNSDSGSNGSSDSGSGGSTAGTGAPATAASAATLPPGASIGSAGFPVMPFSFTFEGSFFRLSDFLRKLDRYVTPKGENVTVNGRLLTVDGIALSAAGSGFPRIKASVAATAYLVPDEQGTFGGATPSGPAANGQPATPGAGTTQPTSGSGTTPGTAGDGTPSVGTQ
jgi:Pilus assembly protein, PilO